MAARFLSRIRTVTRQAFRLADEPEEGGAALEVRNGGGPALLSRLTSPNTALVRADVNWRPEPARLRIEIMASGPFENLRGIRTAVHGLQEDLVDLTREGGLELRLTEVRRTCRHVTAWSRSPVDPGASTTTWECLVEELGDETENKTLLAQAFRDSVRQAVNHIILFGDRFDDGFVFLNAAVGTFRQRGIRVSTVYLGKDFNGRNSYRFLAAGTGGLHLALHPQRGLDSVLAIIAAFACGDHARLAALPASTQEAKALMTQLRRG